MIQTNYHQQQNDTLLSNNQLKNILSNRKQLDFALKLALGSQAYLHDISSINQGSNMSFDSIQNQLSPMKSEDQSLQKKIKKSRFAQKQNIKQSPTNNSVQRPYRSSSPQQRQTNQKIHLVETWISFIKQRCKLFNTLNASRLTLSNKSLSRQSINSFFKEIVYRLEKLEIIEKQEYNAKFFLCQLTEASLRENQFHEKIHCLNDQVIKKDIIIKEQLEKIEKLMSEWNRKLASSVSKSPNANAEVTQSLLKYSLSDASSSVVWTPVAFHDAKQSYPNNKKVKQDNGQEMFESPIRSKADKDMIFQTTQQQNDQNYQFQDSKTQQKIAASFYDNQILQIKEEVERLLQENDQLRCENQKLQKQLTNIKSMILLQQQAEILEGKPDSTTRVDMAKERSQHQNFNQNSNLLISNSARFMNMTNTEEGQQNVFGNLQKSKNLEFCSEVFLVNIKGIQNHLDQNEANLLVELNPKPRQKEGQDFHKLINFGDNSDNQGEQNDDEERYEQVANNNEVYEEFEILREQNQKLREQVKFLEENLKSIETEFKILLAKDSCQSEEEARHEQIESQVGSQLTPPPEESSSLLLQHISSNIQSPQLHPITQPLQKPTQSLQQPNSPPSDFRSKQILLLLIQNNDRLRTKLKQKTQQLKNIKSILQQAKRINDEDMEKLQRTIVNRNNQREKQIGKLKELEDKWKLEYQEGKQRQVELIIKGNQKLKLKVNRKLFRFNTKKISKRA